MRSPRDARADAVRAAAIAGVVAIHLSGTIAVLLLCLAGHEILSRLVPLRWLVPS